MNVARAVLTSCIDAFCSTSIGRHLGNLFALALSMIITAFGGYLGDFLVSNIVLVNNIADTKF